jgi:tetratricopeptide (TPR) repeat protein
LGADVLAPNALLRRAFCVLESFATIKGKGVLLVCGPALEEPAQMLKLAELAADSVECKTVMNSRTAKCRWEDEAIKIKAYINRTVGFSRLDKVVLAAIVSSILRSAESVFAEREDGGASILRAVGWMVYECGDYAAALGLLEKALVKGEAAYGAEAMEIADTVYMIGRCCSKMAREDSEGVGEEWFERDLRIQTQEHGEEHASTARSLLGGIGKIRHGKGWDEEPLASCEVAIQRIKAAERPEDYADDYADALGLIGNTHSAILTDRGCLEWSHRSVEVREAKHGRDHVLAAGALGNMAVAYGKLGDTERGMGLNLRVLGIQERAKGPLSREAGITCSNIGTAYENVGNYAEMASWCKRAVEALEYTIGSANSLTSDCRRSLKNAVKEMDTEKHWVTAIRDQTSRTKSKGKFPPHERQTYEFLSESVQRAREAGWISNEDEELFESEVFQIVYNYQLHYAEKVKWKPGTRRWEVGVLPRDWKRGDKRRTFYRKLELEKGELAKKRKEAEERLAYGGSTSQYRL